MVGDVNIIRMHMHIQLVVDCPVNFIVSLGSFRI